MAGQESVISFSSSLISSMSEAVSHAFFTRIGGVSEGAYYSLNSNLSSEDNKQNVQENLSIIAQELGFARDDLIILNQVHSDKVVVIDEKRDNDEGAKADALVTSSKGIIIGIKTADCVPILFLDPEHLIIGAAHAGWKGAFSGIIDNTIATMLSLGSKRENLVAAIGPCIRQDNYEIGEDFYTSALTNYSNSKDFFKFIAGKIFFNLPGYCNDCLIKNGITKVDDIGFDTYSNPEKFFSYRRSTHQEGPSPRIGTQLSAIVIK